MMGDEENICPVTFWYSTLGMGDGHDFATRGYLRALMKTEFFGLRLPPSITSSVLMVSGDEDSDISQFAELLRPPKDIRMKPLKLIKKGDPRIGTWRTIEGVDMAGKPFKVKVTEGSIDLDVPQEYVSSAQQEVRSIVIHHDPASLARLYSTLTKSGKPNQVGYVGITVWETSSIPEAIAVILNELHALVVPSEHTKKAMRDSGVDIPISVIPHTFDPETWPEPTEAELGYEAMSERLKRPKYVFYSIATPIERKNLRGLMRAYFKAFEDRQDVLLRIKTSGKKNELADVANMALDEAKITGRRPPLRIFTGNWPVDKIRAFHLDGDCYVSACRAEGFGLCEMEAKLCGSRVITSEWGAAREFLLYEESGAIGQKDDGPYRGHAQGHYNITTTGSDILIPCELIPVEGMYGIGCYDEDQLWADPDEDALVAAMRKAAQQRIGPDQVAWKRLRAQLSYEKVGYELAAVILEAREEAEREAREDAF